MAEHQTVEARYWEEDRRLCNREPKGAKLERKTKEGYTVSTGMKKGLHPQMQWISYVTQSGRLMHVMMTKIHRVGKVYHFRAKKQMAETEGQIAKFRRRYGGNPEENVEK